MFVDAQARATSDVLKSCWLPVAEEEVQARMSAQGAGAVRCSAHLWRSAMCR
jgi:hypothetical protein